MTPVEVTKVTDAVQVGAGGQFSCALSATGAVTCWGYNDSGQLAMPRSMPNMSGPVSVAVPAT